MKFSMLFIFASCKNILIKVQCITAEVSVLTCCSCCYSSCLIISCLYRPITQQISTLLKQSIFYNIIPIMRALSGGQFFGCEITCAKNICWSLTLGYIGFYLRFSEVLCSYSIFCKYSVDLQFGYIG
jgi:hypothetical protein